MPKRKKFRDDLHELRIAVHQSRTEIQGKPTYEYARLLLLDVEDEKLDLSGYSMNYHELVAACSATYTLAIRTKIEAFMELSEEKQLEQLQAAAREVNAMIDKAGTYRVPEDRLAPCRSLARTARLL